MKVLIVGGGGREHALAWKCAAAARVSEVLVAPGNAGTAREAKVRNVAVAADDLPALVRLAAAERIDLTIVGPETPLVAGIVDEFAAAGLRCFGPSRGCAQLEGSKAFSKEFMRRHGIPTARSATFTRDSFDPRWVQAQRTPLVVKASGLAAGKGVVIAPSADAALASAAAMFAGQFGAAGNEVLIEEFLPGEEASFIVMADGTHVLPLASSQDHKRLQDGDRGPNTGGMGACSPAPVVTPALHARILRDVIMPAVRGLAADGLPYTGFLYAGLMIGPDGTPNVLEFNCRLGDPEAQPILMRLESDLTLLCEAALERRLASADASWARRAALGVVLAAAGYPESVRTGDPIEGLEHAARLPGKIFHAGTRLESGQVHTSGGRVLCAVGLGGTIGEAQRAAYSLAHAVRWPGMHYRRDIGYHALARERVAASAGS
ncbi:MAG: phosphoribosylamine--glycine ligase [Gammaproteobacteria bacterium]|nr:phosphoribosylamine--glycine ligase [Gammaproteobacteria bacterium]